MTNSPNETLPPFSDRLPLVTYTNRFSPELETVWMSPQVERITGYPAAAWLVKPSLLTRILHPDDRGPVLEEIRASRDDLRDFSRDYRVLAADGRVLWIHDESVLVLGDDGRPEFIQGYFVDISERKELERQLLQAQKSEALARLAAGIAHDFNNLLTAIAGHAELARKTLAPDALSHRHLAAIVASVERAAKLTRELLAFSRRQELAVEPADVTKTVQEMEPVLRHQAGEGTLLELDLSPTSLVEIDVGQFEQVLMNLLANARDAGAGRITIGVRTVSVEQLPEARKLGIVAGEYVLVTVADDGTGIDEETQARIFDPFFTTKDRDSGTGLGLSLAQGVIRQSGGAIEVSSALGSGTTFRILLPVASVG